MSAPMIGDTLHWDVHARVLKYGPETLEAIAYDLGRAPTALDLRRREAAGFEPDDVAEAFGNLLTTAGLNRLTNLLQGGGGAAMTHAQTIVGVGNSTTAATVSDTALGGDGNTANAYYQQADTSYPTQSNGVVTCYCTYQSGNANFAWQEWCFAIGTGTITAGGTLASVATSPILLNHKVQSLGTKTSGSIWTLQATITLS